MRATHAGPSVLTEAVNAIAREQASARRYQERQWHATHAREGFSDGARPLEFDESGFPIRQHSPSVLQRVARLLNPL